MPQFLPYTQGNTSGYQPFYSAQEQGMNQLGNAASGINSGVAGVNAANQNATMMARQGQNALSLQELVNQGNLGMQGLQNQGSLQNLLAQIQGSMGLQQLQNQAAMPGYQYGMDSGLMNNASQMAQAKQSGANSLDLAKEQAASQLGLAKEKNAGLLAFASPLLQALTGGRGGGGFLSGLGGVQGSSGQSAFLPGYGSQLATSLGVGGNHGANDNPSGWGGPPRADDPSTWAGGGMRNNWRMRGGNGNFHGIPYPGQVAQ